MGPVGTGQRSHQPEKPNLKRRLREDPEFRKEFIRVIWGMELGDGEDENFANEGTNWELCLMMRAPDGGHEWKAEMD